MLGFLLRLPFYIGLAVIGALVVGYFSLGHRVTGAALSYSLARAAGGSSGEDCRRVAVHWRCQVSDGNGLTPYRVRVDGHCWHATKVHSGPAFAGRLHGCVGVRDQVRLGNILN